MREEFDRFRSEAEALARLQHPNIVQVHDYGEVDGQGLAGVVEAEGLLDESAFALEGARF